MRMKHLPDIGPSDEIREMVSRVDITSQTIPLILDQPRTLGVTRKSIRNNELVVHCKDETASVVLYLPYAPGARGRASVITYIDEGS